MGEGRGRSKRDGSVARWKRKEKWAASKLTLKARRDDGEKSVEKVRKG